MALSRMIRISNLCFKENILVQKHSSKIKNVRNFRKDRNINEVPKVNPDSLATPFSKTHIDPGKLRVGNLVKPFLFTVGFSGACFLGASIWEYENMRGHAKRMLKKPMKFFKRQVDSGYTSTNAILKELKIWWSGLTEGERVFAPICALNILVFFAWRVPRFQPTMLRYFCSNPASQNICIPMVLSTFSHYSGLHLLANMYVLHSFSTGAVHSLGKEQFLGLYMAAGVVSSFTSYMYKIITKQPGLSLGASGAIMAILGYVCTQYPDTRLGIIFLPVFTFSAGAAIKFIVGLDTAGVLLGWKFFDHAAHLGGAACGIFWALWGNQYIWQNRGPVLQYWHHLRGSIK
ncbi:presenilins-associated rhomboid-like protein, mitochondrial [Diorhabda sublineata]|uniref:presenilins-associated rhomboid-like protein, mitochondrial n=1 Tax=Diorhabda sublineata TaxID=1163346 RepID=UPI0024E16486|nr:presenilins-associated rhomboid-like protein, mitochondrial [Diorhabda sublineata]